MREMGWVMGEGGQMEAGYTFHNDKESSAVSSLSDRNEYNLQHKPRRSLAAVCHNMHPC